MTVAAPRLTVLGVDTSLRSTGVAVLETDGLSHVVRGYGNIRCPASWPLSRCLAHLQESIASRIAEFSPTVLAIEGIFFCRNVRTAVVLGEARGVVIATAAQAGLAVYEYAPRSVKQGVVGSGRASKDQVGLMVKSLFRLTEVPQEDAADALAIAYCHANQMRFAEQAGVDRQI